MSHNARRLRVLVRSAVAALLGVLSVTLALSGNAAEDMAAGAAPLLGAGFESRNPAALPAMKLAQAPSPWGRPGHAMTLFTNTNVATVFNQPHRSTTFRLEREAAITSIKTYHWNGGQGAWPGTIGLRSRSGQMYGPWHAFGELGQGGVFNAYWVVSVRIVLPRGVYTIVDSDPSTWAQNRDTGGAGMAWVEGWYNTR